MIFKKGTKVEVLSKAEVPSGSWLCAKIIYGNGHNYTVKYDGYQGAAGEKILERVSRKAMRPCPPALELAENWCPGDVVEVFQNSSWRMATVLKVLGEKHILVRLLGSSLKFQVIRSDIRVRQSWQDDKWIVVGKGSASCENGNRDNTLISRQNLIPSAQLQKTAIKIKLSDSGDYHPEKKEWNILESYPLSSKRLKRGSHSLIDSTYAGPPSKFRAIENEGRSQKATNHADSVTSSVASCSITSKNFPPTQEALTPEIHRLELHAYRCTIEALHASGPLSWEQEALITNLRLSLHISNDEHLMELRNLISSDVKHQSIGGSASCENGNRDNTLVTRQNLIPSAQDSYKDETVSFQ